MQTHDPFFAGRTAIVTGGASGIGRAVVTQLVRAGARVFSLDAQDQDDGPSPWLVPVRLDLADAGAIDAFFEELDASQIDFVCNAAGVSPLRETLERVIAIDFLALRRVCAHALPRMAEPGAIVNIASVAGVYASLDPMVEPLLAASDDVAALAAARAKIPDAGVAYSVAKRAVIRLSLRLAAEHAARRVRVNAVSPHAAATPMHYAIKRDEPAIYRGAKMTSTWGGRWSSADEQVHQRPESAGRRRVVGRGPDHFARAASDGVSPLSARLPAAARASPGSGAPARRRARDSPRDR
jgi:NAD(P)-dependent dehydrogenase (short-subunit alcohol dehydrogenase family)